MITMRSIKINCKHNEGIFWEIRNRVMKKMWSIIPSALVSVFFLVVVFAVLCSVAVDGSYSSLLVPSFIRQFLVL